MECEGKYQWKYQWISQRNHAVERTFKNFIYFKIIQPFHTFENLFEDHLPPFREIGKRKTVKWKRNLEKNVLQNCQIQFNAERQGKVKTPRKKHRFPKSFLTRSLSQFPTKPDNENLHLNHAVEAGKRLCPNYVRYLSNLHPTHLPCLPKHFDSVFKQ